MHSSHLRTRKRLSNRSGNRGLKILIRIWPDSSRFLPVPQTTVASTTTTERQEENPTADLIKYPLVTGPMFIFTTPIYHSRFFPNYGGNDSTKPNQLVNCTIICFYKSGLIFAANSNRLELFSNLFEFTNYSFVIFNTTVISPSMCKLVYCKLQYFELALLIGLQT